jgi:hypothetical protein
VARIKDKGQRIKLKGKRKKVKVLRLEPGIRNQESG